MNRVLLSLSLMVAAFVILVPGIANAHNTALYFPLRWESDLTQNWFFTATFPGGDWRNRVRDGLNYPGAGGHGPNWNRLGEPLVWTETAQRADFNPLVCPAAGTNGIHWRNIDGRDGTLAQVVPCVFTSDPSRIASMNMMLDRSEDWYTGTGDAPNGSFIGNQAGGACVFGPCKIDAWSVAAHEWGHVVGFTGGPNGDGHFPLSDSSTCPDDQAENTMCAGYHKGTERKRTLESHDKHTFQAAY